jgi:shikimate kinase
VHENATVWLVGMMGAGKSTVGRVLAERLHTPYVDIDAEVEREAGCTVAEIFEREGESGFRARERAAIDAWAGAVAVVALGGGAIAQPGAAPHLAASGTIVYLRARLETLLERSGAGPVRPLLAGLDGAARRSRLEGLLAQRRDAYESAQIIVDVDEGSPEDLAEIVARRIAGSAAS